MPPGCGGSPFRALTLIGSVSLAIVLASAGDECLPDAITPERRANITVNGVSMPVGVVHQEWDSARQASQVYTILAEEILGYNTEWGPGLHGGIACMYRLMGCANPSNPTDPQCDDAVPGSSRGYHVLLELWHGGNSFDLDRIYSEFPAIAPLDLGSIGYFGTEEMYILAGPREQALSDGGLALEYFRSYNASWFQVSQYFPLRTSNVDTAKLKPCSEVDYVSDDTIWRQYLSYTGDADGVVIDSEGRHRASCWDEFFWFAPACRADPSTCVLVITGGPGWGLDAYTQKAAHYNMPFAFATAATWGDYLILPRESGAPLYWWTPDISFVDLSPSRIVFPDHSKAAWTVGDKRTAAEQVTLSSKVFNGLETLAPRLASLADSFSLEVSDMDAMLMDKGASGDSYRAVACRWLQANVEVWERWIPDETTCTAGMGLVNESDAYVHNRSLASSCAPCMPGTFSVELIDIRGKTRVCSPCAPGSFQKNPLEESCSLCPPGKLSTEWGHEQCELCPQMYFQPGYNSTQCELCPTPMTTQVLGALSVSACICPEGTYKPLSPNGPTCKDCPVGMSCAEGSDEANLPSSAAGVSSEVAYPRLDAGYYAEFASPLSVYRCRDDGTCLGTDSERCAPNMEGIACGRCRFGYYHSGDGCSRCNDLETSQILFPVLPILLGPVAVYVLHRFSRDPVERWGNPANSFQSALYVALVYVQMLASINTMYISVPDIFGDSVGWSSNTYDLLSLMRPECAVLEDFATGFAVKLFIPAYAALLFLMTYCASKALELWKPALHLDRDIVFNNFMAVFYTFFVGIAAQTISLWQCYAHPNGTSSLVSAPDVLCFEETWNGLVAASVIATLIFCVGSFILFSWAVLVAPSRFQEESFRKRWKFLFIKFRPDVHWWGIVLLLRGIWVPFTTVVFDVGARQIIWLGIMVLTYLICSFAMLPWRSFTVAALDIVVHASLLFLFVLLPHFAEPGEVSDEELAKSALAVSCIPFCCAGGCLFYMAGKVLSRQWCSSSAISVNPVKMQELCEVFNNIDPAELAEVWNIIPSADRKLLISARNLLASEVFEILSGSRLCSYRSKEALASAEVLCDEAPPTNESVTACVPVCVSEAVGSISTAPSHSAVQEVTAPHDETTEGGAWAKAVANNGVWTEPSADVAPSETESVETPLPEEGFMRVCSSPRRDRGASRKASAV